jgi:hypothetical protein
MKRKKLSNIVYHHSSVYNLFSIVPEISGEHPKLI